MSESNFESMPDSMIAGMLMHISSEVHHSHRAIVDEARRRLALRDEHRWIPVEERLPQAECPVLTLCNGKTRSVQYRFFDGGWTTSATVTHWMPLPEPPKKEVQG